MFPVSKNQDQNKTTAAADKVYRQTDFNKINKHPGFATSIFVSWDSIADYFDLASHWPIYKEGEAFPEEFIQLAFNEAQNWGRLYKNHAGRNPSEEALLEKESEILQSIHDHWSPGFIFIEKFDFEHLVKDVNEWSHRGAKQPQLFGNVPDPGKALEYFITDLGINFTVYAPFMLPYTEVFYQLYDSLPEWNYEEIEGLDIIETLFSVQDMQGNNTEVDLDDWASRWRFDTSPTVHTELEMDDLI